MLLGLPLTTPLWRWTYAACTHDGHLHYHRVAAMRHAWENGLYFSRWLPDLAFGYGYPFFLYREPAPLYLTLFPHLWGLPLSAAGNLFYIGSILFGGVSTFLWVRDIFGNRSGIVAGFAYMSAPYVLIDAYVRGNQPETLALALFPFLLWAGRRAMRSDRVIWFIITVLGLAFFSLSHNISLLLFTPFLLVYMFIIGVTELQNDGMAESASSPIPSFYYSVILKIALIFTLGLGITAFYPGSALLEMDEVTLSLSTTTRNNDFRFNFATLAEIFQPISTSDPNLLNPPLPFRLGWVPTGLALLGTLIGLRRGNREQRIHVIFLLLSAIFFIFMAHRASFWLWDNLPLIDFVQFPWRFVGRAALPVAVLAGAVFSDIRYPVSAKRESNAGHRPSDTETPSVLPSFRPSFTPSFVILSSVILLLFLETTPNLYPRMCEEEAFPTIGDVFLYEHVTGLVGVDPEGSYFPQTVRERPSGSVLEGDYAAGQLPRRIDQRVFPEGAILLEADYQNNQTVFLIDTQESFTARYLTFAFPGWQARLNGEPLEIVPSQPEGLITFDIPAGQHRVEVFFGWTSLRLTLAMLSALALITFITIIPFYTNLLNQTRPSTLIHHSVTPSAVSAFPSVSVIRNRIPPVVPSLLLTVLLLFTLKFTLLDQALSPLRQPNTPALSPTETVIGAELELVAKQLPSEPVPADQPLVIDLGWRANTVPTERYQTALTLVGSDGLRWSEKELFRPRIYEDMPDTVYWKPGEWGWDSWEIEPFSGILPGRYEVELTLFDRETLQPVPLVDGNRADIGLTAVIGEVDIGPSRTEPMVQPQYETDIELPQTGLRLIGYALDRELVDPNEKMLVTFYFEKISVPAQHAFDLQFVDSGHLVETQALDISGPLENLDQLPLGTRFRSQHFMPVPGALDVEQYDLVLDAGSTLPLRPIGVRQYARTFEEPVVSQPVDQVWEDEIRLSGYTLEAEGQAYNLILSWQALANIDGRYRIFVHGLNSEGVLVSQSDGEPAKWERPTNSWAEGEFILDTHRIVWEETQQINQLLVGIYDPQTGRRLLQSTGQDTFLIDRGQQSTDNQQ
ncbi:MAG: glycosyltransferase family 39 protein [Chloroflexota bacterium]